MDSRVETVRYLTKEDLKLMMFNPKPGHLLEEWQTEFMTQLDKITTRFEGKLLHPNDYPIMKKMIAQWRTFYLTRYYRLLFKKQPRGQMDDKAKYYFGGDMQKGIQEIDEPDLLMHKDSEYRLSIYMFVKIMEFSSMCGSIIPPEIDNLHWSQGKAIREIINNWPESHLVEGSQIHKDLRGKLDEFYSNLLYSFQNKTVTWNDEEQGETTSISEECARPPLFNLFEASHFYFQFETMMRSQQVYGFEKRRIPDTFRGPQTIEKIISDQLWLLTKVSGGKPLDKIQYAVYNFAGFPGIREATIYEKTCRENPGYLMAILKAIINRRMKPSEALQNYQTECHEFIVNHIYNIERGDLGFLTKSKYKGLSLCLFLTILDMLFLDRCQYECWLFVCVVLKEGLDRFPKDIELFTQKIPQFIEMEHENFYVVHDKIAWYTDDPYVLIEWWFDLFCKNNKLIPCIENIASTVPSVFIWRKNLRSHVDLDTIGMKSCIDVSSILKYDPHYRRKMEMAWMKAKNTEENMGRRFDTDDDLTKDQLEYLERMYGHTEKRCIDDVYAGDGDDDDEYGGITVRPTFQEIQTDYRLGERRFNERPDPPSKKQYTTLSEIQRDAQKLLDQVKMTSQDPMDEVDDDEYL